MAKFCGNCGTKLDDSAKVCGNCGTPLEVSTTKISGIEYSDPEKKKKLKKKIKAFMIAVIVIVILFFAVKVALSFTGAQGAVRNVMKAYKEYDIESLIDMSSDIYFVASGDYAEYYFENAISDDFDRIEAQVGHSYKVSYKIDEIYTLSDRKYTQILDELKVAYAAFDVDSVSKIVEADLTVVAKSKTRSVEQDLKVTLSKERGEWRILYIQ